MSFSILRFLSPMECAIKYHPQPRFHFLPAIALCIPFLKPCYFKITNPLLGCPGSIRSICWIRLARVDNIFLDGQDSSGFR